MLIGMPPTSGMAGFLSADTSRVGLFDWLRRTPPEDVVWEVRCEGPELVASDGKHPPIRVPLAGAQAVRVIPLSGGSPHGSTAGGWQVALAYPEGDRVIGPPQRDWRPARVLADGICVATTLPLDELTASLFSRVGQFPPPSDAASR
jgi:hypothetical protein